MADNFYKYWFKGFERYIENLDPKSIEDIFRECGKSCSDSYTNQIYINEYNAAKSFEEFLCRLKSKFPEVDFNILKENEIIELTYNFCACDLVKNEYVKTPLLCECSKQSLYYNWSTVMGQGNVKVRLVNSILNGDSSCKFIINIG